MWTTDDLITSVRVRGMFPDASQGSLSPASILMFAYEELIANVVPMILSVREHYYETYLDQNMIAGVQVYAIPQRSIASTLSVVQYILRNSIMPLNPIDPQNVVSTVPELYPKAFYYQGGSIVLDQVPSSSQGTIRMRYYQRPGIFTSTVNCGLITGVSTLLNTVTVASVPASWAAGTVFDFIPSYLPYMPYGLSTACTGVTGTTVSFSALPVNAAGAMAITVGDWLAPAGYSCIPEVPNEVFPLLAQATAVKLLEATGAEEHLGTAAGMLANYAKNATRLISPRDQWGLKKVCSAWRNR